MMILKCKYCGSCEVSLEVMTFNSWFWLLKMSEKFFSEVRNFLVEYDIPLVLSIWISLRLTWNKHPYIKSSDTFGIPLWPYDSMSIFQKVITENSVIFLKFLTWNLKFRAKIGKNCYTFMNVLMLDCKIVEYFG